MKTATSETTWRFYFGAYALMLTTGLAVVVIPAMLILLLLVIVRGSAGSITWAFDKEVKQLYYIFRAWLIQMASDIATLNQAGRLLLVAKHLERIGDYVTDIGEQVVYLKKEKGNLLDSPKSFIYLMRPARLERATFWFVAKRSIQLSYGRV